jgi:hypothetical protein
LGITGFGYFKTLQELSGCRKEPAKSQLLLGWLLDSLGGKKGETMVTNSSRVFEFFYNLGYRSDLSIWIFNNHGH